MTETQLTTMIDTKLKDKFKKYCIDEKISIKDEITKLIEKEMGE